VPHFAIPDSNSEDASPVREFNPCHKPGGSPIGGQFADKGDCGPAVGTATPEKAGYYRRKAIRVDSIEKAVELILKGEVVELPDVKGAATVLDRLAAMATEAVKLGKQAPTYDLCQVSVPGTNLFCSETIRSKAYPKGIPRIEMPQLAGDPTPGSAADKLPKGTVPGKPNEVDASGEFIAHLKQKGLKTTREVVPASRLKAAQREMVGPVVAGMIADRTFDPANAPIFISRDNYIIDGHHRWAATVGRDAEDGVLGDKRMRVIRIDAPISEVLFLANSWTRRFGIAARAGVKK
jgi:hypothetical protein